MAAAALAAAGQGNRIVSRFADEPGAPTVVTLLERGLNAPETSSLGRWFDAVAGLLDVRRQAAFEGQAAMLLEGLAETHGPVAPDRSLFALNDANELDLLPLALHVADLDDPAYAAALFHATLAAALAEWATRAAKQTGLSVVACGGGCLLNAIVALHLRQAFDAAGLRMLEARAVPPNDGGLALGQAWVALQAIHSS
jgi:hydrogenase maturation protein HypF